MEKRDLAILGILIALLLMWPVFGPQVEEKLFPKPPKEAVAPAEGSPSPAVPPVAPPVEPAETATPSLAEAGEAPIPTQPETPAQPEERAVLTNALLRVDVSSHGATVRSVVLHDYRQSLDKDSRPVEMDFSERPALAYEGLPGLGRDDAFTLTVEEPGHAVRFERVNAAGLKLERTVRLAENYAIEVVDTFTRDGEAVLLPAVNLGLGIMREPAAQKGRYAALNLGVDTLLQGGEGVKYFGKKILPKHVKASDRDEASLRVGTSVGWVAAKNRYFVQILAPEEGGQDAWVYGRRKDLEAKTLEAVSASIEFDPVSVGEGTAITRNMVFYAGPKKYAVLIDYGHHFVDVMEFGFFSPISKFLLWVLNFIHDAIWPHNYGIAVILLTIIIRVLFWPVTHKGTESMRRMQEIQPKIKELREKIKDPQKQQQALMGLYKEHKINPLGGCLPMVVQIPVFFALFVVLRSAIELRYASFLWISNLSEPEGLFSEVLPFGGLNILPIIMAVTMVWQQKLTPTTGDPRQAKMMQFMPIMMLVLFYGFASGLVLYWTTNQCLMILQQLVYKKRRERKEAAA